MTTPRSTPPFRADHVGSLLRPKVLQEARAKWKAGALPHDGDVPARWRGLRLGTRVQLGPMSTDDDGELMLRYARGDMRAFETLYRRHKNALYRYLARQTRNTETANDLFQEVWQFRDVADIIRRQFHRDDLMRVGIDTEM